METTKKIEIGTIVKFDYWGKIARGEVIKINSNLAMEILVYELDAEYMRAEKIVGNIYPGEVTICK